MAKGRKSAKFKSTVVLEVNKRVYLERRSLYLKTHCEKKRSVRKVINQLLESSV